jgi:protein-tyrosine phosphatase
MAFRVLYICLGNTCRSPALADLLNSNARSRYKKGVIEASSAAITKYNVGDGIDPLMKQVASEKGVKLKRHKARLLTKDIIAQSDLILGVTEDVCEMIRVQCKESEDEKKVFLATHFCLTYMDEDIIDPFAKEKKQYEEVFSQIETIISETIDSKKFMSICSLDQPE